jgi:hypothetical protein
MLALDYAGADKNAQAFDVFTRHGAFAGVIVERYGKGCKVYFNSNCTKGSGRIFSNVHAAADYIIARRIKKGWRV